MLLQQTYSKNLQLSRSIDQLKCLTAAAKKLIEKEQVEAEIQRKKYEIPSELMMQLFNQPKKEEKKEDLPTTNDKVLKHIIVDSKKLKRIQWEPDSPRFKEAQFKLGFQDDDLKLKKLQEFFTDESTPVSIAEVRLAHHMNKLKKNLNKVIVERLKIVKARSKQDEQPPNSITNPIIPYLKKPTLLTNLSLPESESARKNRISHMKLSRSLEEFDSIKKSADKDIRVEESAIK